VERASTLGTEPIPNPYSGIAPARSKNASESTTCERTYRTETELILSNFGCRTFSLRVGRPRKSVDTSLSDSPLCVQDR